MFGPLDFVFGVTLDDSYCFILIAGVIGVENSRSMVGRRGEGYILHSGSPFF